MRGKYHYWVCAQAQEGKMKKYAVIMLILSILLAAAASSGAQSAPNHTAMLTVGMVPWISGVGAEYLYRYRNWGFGADLMFGRNSGAVRGFSTHAIAKWHLPIIEELSAFLSVGAGITYTWSEYSPDYLYFNPYVSAGFEGRYKWLVSSLEAGYGPGIGQFVTHSAFVKFGIGVAF